MMIRGLPRLLAIDDTEYVAIYSHEMETVLAHQFSAKRIWQYLNPRSAWNLVWSFTHASTSNERVRTSSKVCEVCAADRIDRKAHIVSAPKSLEDDSFSCYVEFENQLHQISWANTENYPDISEFPSVEGTSSLVKISALMASTISASNLVNFGVDGVIRCLHLEPYPIVKIAHPNETSRTRIRYELKMLVEMTVQSLPVPRLHDEPLVDEEGIFGYRMERLLPVDYADLSSISEDVRATARLFHDRGYSHGDLNPSNIMRDVHGRLVFIDTSFSGRLDTKIPDHVPKRQYTNSLFDRNTDLKYLDMFFP